MIFPFGSRDSHRRDLFPLLPLHFFAFPRGRPRFRFDALSVFGFGSGMIVRDSM
jgi:hypothetical protein